VTEYQVVAKVCPACGETTMGTAPTGVSSLAQYGPVVHAKAALAVCTHYLPIARAAGLVAYTGVQGSHVVREISTPEPPVSLPGKTR
jgi:hypothetical protein